ncbi:MAG: hypothetical protein LLG01_15015 [Planctomycetaceae bacterium]|nr:hypothetical protein [Planctomycetaceae bacterium]
MSKIKLILIAAYLLAIAAGVLVGMNIAQDKPRHRSELTSRLNLTPAQREQMRKIWSDPRLRGDPRRGPGRGDLARNRDEAVMALLTPQQRQAYDAIQKDYAAQIEKQSLARRQAFDKAVEETKKILTPEQAATYEEMMRQRDPRQRRGGGGERFRDHRHTSASKPASAATQTQSAAQSEQ